ncbi:MAG: O-antigen ligase family protein [Candidatus Omnitrophota bacterium]|nr:O-antigen ligase family protein [Candidatus Omnitrophota bacterium]
MLLLNRIALGAILGIVFFIPISSAAIESFFGVLGICAALRLLHVRPCLADVKSFFWNPLHATLTVFYVLLGISILAAGPLWPKSLEAWLTKWGEWLLLFCLIRLFVQREHLKWISYILVFTAALICVDGIFQKITGYDFIRGFEIVPANYFLPVRASLHHYNHFGGYLAVIFFMITAVLINVKDRAKCIALIGLLGLIFVNLLLSYSRGAWLAFASGCLWFFATSPKQKFSYAILSLLGALLGLIFLHPGLRERAVYLFTSGGDEQRFEVWKAALRVWMESPYIGRGLGLLMDYLPEYLSQTRIKEVFWAQYAHNSYLQILVESGPLALLSFLLAALGILLRGFRAAKGYSPAHALVAAYVVLLVHCFFENHLYSLQLSALFWVSAAFVSRIPELGLGEGQKSH